MQKRTCKVAQRSASWTLSRTEESLGERGSKIRYVSRHSQPLIYLEIDIPDASLLRFQCSRHSLLYKEALTSDQRIHGDETE